MQTKWRTSEGAVAPPTAVATSTPAGTPTSVPSTRCQPLARVWPREVVPEKMTKVAITAHYHRADDNSSPATMAAEEATATWMAWRVEGRARRRSEVGC